MADNLSLALKYAKEVRPVLDGEEYQVTPEGLTELRCRLCEEKDFSKKNVQENLRLLRTINPGYFTRA